MNQEPTFRMYVDENGNANYKGRVNLANPSNRFLCLTGVIMRRATHDTLTQQINALKLKYFGSVDIILHRQEIISGEGPFAVLKDSVIRDEFDSDMLQIISDLPYRVISVVIDKKTLVERYRENTQDPYAIALEFLMQRYLYWMEGISTFGDTLCGDIMAEARGKGDDRITKETYRRIYHGGGYNSLNNASQFYSSSEIKLKPKKANIAGLQFVDIISHPARRYILSQSNLAMNLSPRSFEQRIVDVLVEKKFRRQNGQIKSFGTIFFPY